MKVSYENLNKLKTPEYQEYKSFKNKIVKYFNEERTGSIALYLLNTTFWIVIIFGFYHQDEKIQNNFLQTLLLILFCGLHPITWFPVFLITLLFRLDKLYSRIYKHFEKNFYLFSRLKELETYFSPIKKQVRRELEIYLNEDVYDIINRLRERPTRDETYLNLIEMLKSNHFFVEDAIRETGTHYRFKPYRNLYKNIIENGDTWLEKQIQIRKKIRESEQKFDFHKEVKDKKKEKQNLINPIGINNSNNQVRKNTRAEIYKDLKNRETEIIETLERKFNFKIKKQKQEQLRLDFENSQNILQKSDNIPLKKAKKVPEKKREFDVSRIKASQAFWKRLASRRIEIGKSGELLVMKYEKERIIIEEGKEFVSRLIHSSEKIGDWLGYDICSIENQKEIYIEVKTTTGNFQSDLYFTNNELNTMKKLGKQYYLYRIYEFNPEQQSGKLFIFRGEEEITAYFDFTPQNYLLKPKEQN